MCSTCRVPRSSLASTSAGMIHLRMKKKISNMPPKTRKGVLYPPKLYIKDPKTGEIVTPMPTDISINPITAA